MKRVEAVKFIEEKLNQLAIDHWIDGSPDRSDVEIHAKAYEITAFSPQLEREVTGRAVISFTFVDSIEIVGVGLRGKVFADSLDWLPAEAIDQAPAETLK